MDKKTISIYYTKSYCEGYNDAIESIKKYNTINQKTVSMCVNPEYCHGWNRAFYDFNGGK